MPLRSRKPTSAGRRFQTVSDFSEITKEEPEKSLVKPKKRSSGRNVYGRMTSRHHPMRVITCSCRKKQPRVI